MKKETLSGKKLEEAEAREREAEEEAKRKAALEKAEAERQAILARRRDLVLDLVEELDGVPPLLEAIADTLRVEYIEPAAEASEDPEDDKAREAMKYGRVRRMLRNCNIILGNE